MRHGRIYSTDVAASILQKRRGDAAALSGRAPRDGYARFKRGCLPPFSLPSPYVCICRTWALCTAIQVGKHGQMLDIVRLRISVDGSLTMSQKRAVAVFGGKRTFVWKGAKLPVNGRRIMPVVFVSLELRSFDICRKNLIRRSRIKRLDFEPRFCHQTLSHKWSYMDIIMRPFNLFAQLNLNNYIAKLFFWKLMNVCIVSTLHYIMINVITA